MERTPETILVVDDNKDDVFLLEHAIRRLGIINPLQKLDNGQEALEYLAGSGKYADRVEYPYPAFVLLDLHLPQQTGFQVLEWLRKNPQPNLRIVVCTGTAMPEEVERAYKLGAERLFDKPPDFVRFVRQLETVPGVHVLGPERARELVFD